MKYKLTKEEEDLLVLIEKSEDNRFEFFKEADGFKWFYPLKEKGFFDPKTIEPDRPSSTDGRYFISKPWGPGKYLSRISSKLKSEEGKEFQEDILSIIENITQYSRDNGISNLYAWPMCADILADMPREAITDKMIKNIGYWASIDTPDFPEYIKGWLYDLIDESTPRTIYLAGQILTQIFWNCSDELYEEQHGSVKEKYNEFEKKWSADIHEEVLYKRRTRGKTYYENTHMCTKGLFDFHEGLCRAFETVRNGIPE